MYANSNPVLFSDPSGNTVVTEESIVEVEGGINAIDKGLNLAAVGTIFGAGATAIGVGDRAGGSTATHGFVAVQSYGGVQLRYAGAGFDRVDAAVFPRGATL